MGACDIGGCCKSRACLDGEAVKRCCCQARGGSWTDYPCRMVSCVTGSGCSEELTCACLALGGTFSQSCDPCANVSCNKCETCRDGKCVSTCAACEDCDTTSINGTCRPKDCGFCKQCRATVVDGQSVGLCVPSGVQCGNNCCDFSQCCVDGACAACDCRGQTKPLGCFECRNGKYVKTCTSTEKCCPGDICQPECCDSGDCPANNKCDTGRCKPLECSDFKFYETFTQADAAPGTPFYEGYWYNSTGETEPPGTFDCPAGCISTYVAEYAPSAGYKWPPPWGTRLLYRVCSSNPLP